MVKVAVCLIIFLMVGSTEAMQVSFFEEFPNENTLEKITLLNFDAQIYVAAGNLSQFYDYEARFKAQNEHVKKVVYWPVLKREEGYWISPWSDSEALERVFEEIKGRNNKQKLDVLLDLEPSLKRSRLFSFKEFNRNKDYLKEFVKEADPHNLSISTVEKSYISERILEYFGLSFNQKEYGNKKIKMYYSSYRRIFLPDFVVDKLYEHKIKKYAETGVRVGLGLIAPGIHDETHYLSPEVLQRELQIASNQGIEEVIIFRLEGLNEEYLKVMRKFIEI